MATKQDVAELEGTVRALEGQINSNWFERERLRLAQEVYRINERIAQIYEQEQTSKKRLAEAKERLTKAKLEVNPTVEKIRKLANKLLGEDK